MYKKSFPFYNHIGSPIVQYLVGWSTSRVKLGFAASPISMDKPYNSVIWSDDFMGGGEGAVRSGSFGHWDTQFGYGHLRRILAGQGKLMSKQDV
jgi:hypothetical protein